MKFSIDPYEKDLIIETIEYRIENDDRLIREVSIKDELTYFLERLEDEYV